VVRQCPEIGSRFGNACGGIAANSVVFPHTRVFLFDKRIAIYAQPLVCDRNAADVLPAANGMFTFRTNFFGIGLDNTCWATETATSAAVL
jgi:hypothetical protein